MLEYIKHLLQLVVSPAQGWTDIARDERAAFRHDAQELRYGPRKGASAADGTPLETDEMVENHWEGARVRGLYTRCFLPLVGVCAASVFVRMAYAEGPGFLKALQLALVTFVSLFLSSQVSRYVFGVAMPRLNGWRDDSNSWRGQLLIMFTLSFLAIVTLVENVVKVRIALLDFLPFYSAFIVWKGARFMQIEEKNILAYVAVATTTLLGSEYVLSNIFKAII